MAEEHRQRILAMAVQNHVDGIVAGDVLNLTTAKVVFRGHKGYDDFCSHADSSDEVQSGIRTEKRVSTEGMRLGQRLIITWRPDRRIVIRHLGGCRFEIMEAQNTKLCVGDTFRCHLMIQHEPLYLDGLIHQGLPETAYVAGQRDGVVISACG